MGRAYRQYVLDTVLCFTGINSCYKCQPRALKVQAAIWVGFENPSASWQVQHYDIMLPVKSKNIHDVIHKFDNIIKILVNSQKCRSVISEQ